MTELEGRIQAVLAAVFPDLQFDVREQEGSTIDSDYVWVTQLNKPESAKECGGWSWSVATVRERFPKAMRDLIRWTDSYNDGPKYVGRPEWVED